MDLLSYENLVTYRNSLKIKYMDFLRLILDLPVSQAAVTDSILFAFDLDNAVGVNLDTIGELVGVKRLLPFVPTTGTREMSDDEYRMLIRLKIARNVWDGRNEPILGIYRSIFPELNIAYTDNQDMTITLTASGVFEEREAEILAASGYILVPAGVGYNVITYGGETSFKLYVGVAQHGELIIDRVQMGQRTWQDALDEFLTWGNAKTVSWGDFMYGAAIETAGVTWGDIKGRPLQWGNMKDYKWSKFGQS